MFFKISLLLKINDFFDSPRLADEATRNRSRTSQRLQTIGQGGILLPSPLKSNRVSSALTVNAASALNSSQGSNSSGGGGRSPKTIDDGKVTGDGSSTGYKRVTRSTTTTKRWLWTFLLIISIAFINTITADCLFLASFGVGLFVIH